MAATVLSMSMSLDGFIAGPNEGPGNGLGDGGERLHEWVFPAGAGADHKAISDLGGVNGQIVHEFILDELEIHLIPVLLGQGRRLFDNLGPEHIELERTRVLQGEAGVTHLHYRVNVRPSSRS